MLSRRTLLQTTAQAPALSAAQTAAGRPVNIVFLISDDHTWSDLGCYGNTAVTTPNLDRMAREGMRFNHGYVSSPQCSPNRSSHFTGCTPHTTNMSRLHTPLADWEPTIIDMLKEKGYHTGIFRKHHQGTGFQKRLDFYGTAKQPFSEFFDRLPAGKPFFLQLGFTDPHRPYMDGAFQPPHDPAKVRVPAFLPDHADVRKDLAHYYDFIARMDAECGRFFELLKQRGHGDNTVVFFTGDNGMPFPRAKGGCYDPGIRTPLLAWWPGKIQPGAVNDDLIAHVDLPATWLEIAGLKKTAKMQGQSFLPALLGQPYTKRTAIFSERNWHDNFDPIRCVRTATHKLIFNAIPTMPYRPATDLWNSPTWARMQRMSKEGGLSDELRMLFSPSRPVMELYDLEQDRHEFQNRIGDPALKPVRDDLLRRLSEWMHQTRDYLPPAYPGSGEPQGRIWPTSL